MSERIPTHYDDEIDLFEVLETLWAGKFLILATTLLPLFTAYGLLLSSTASFEVKVPYRVQVATIDAYNPSLCDNKQCQNRMVAIRADSLSNGEWRSTDKESALILTTESPKSIAEYQDELAELNLILRADMLKEAEAEANFIESEISNDLQQTEVVAGSLLRAKRVMFLLEREATPLKFGAISISMVNQPKLAILFMSALLGAISGCTFLLFRKTYRDRHMTSA